MKTVAVLVVTLLLSACGNPISSVQPYSGAASFPPRSREFESLAAASTDVYYRSQILDRAGHFVMSGTCNRKLIDKFARELDVETSQLDTQKPDGLTWNFVTECDSSKIEQHFEPSSVFIQDLSRTQDPNILITLLYSEKSSRYTIVLRGVSLGFFKPK